MPQRVLFKLCMCLLLVTALVALPQNVFSTNPPRLIFGSVISSITGQPLAGATVAVNNCGFNLSTSTGSNGAWQLMFQAGTYAKLTFSASGYRTQTYEITYNANLVYAGGIVTLTPA